MLGSFSSLGISNLVHHSFDLSKARLLSGDVAPLLDDGLLDLPGVGPGPGADLLGHVHALLGGLQLGNKLGHMLASPLGLKATLLLGSVLDHGLHLVKALLISLLEATASWGTELPGLLGALGVGGVAAGVVLALLLHFSPALDHVVL